jgi:hypothetical protein
MGSSNGSGIADSLLLSAVIRSVALAIGTVEPRGSLTSKCRHEQVVVKVA